MPLQTSGAISLQNIKDEFGVSSDVTDSSIPLSDFYAVSNGVPYTGPISLSNFYGEAQFTETYRRVGEIRYNLPNYLWQFYTNFYTWNVSPPTGQWNVSFFLRDYPTGGNRFFEMIFRKYDANGNLQLTRFNNNISDIYTFEVGEYFYIESELGHSDPSPNPSSVGYASMSLTLTHESGSRPRTISFLHENLLEFR